MMTSSDADRLLETMRRNYALEDRNGPAMGRADLDGLVQALSDGGCLGRESLALDRWMKDSENLTKNPGRRLEGVRLMGETLRQADPQTFRIHALDWYRQLRRLSFDAGDNDDAAILSRAASLTCLGDVAAASAPFPELARELSGREWIPSTAISLLTLLDEKTTTTTTTTTTKLRESAIRCLLRMIKAFPGPVSSIGKGKVERRCLHLMERAEDEEALLPLASSLFSLLPLLGSPGLRRRDAWASNFRLLLRTLDAVVDDVIRDFGVAMTTTTPFFHGGAASIGRRDNESTSLPSEEVLPLKTISKEDPRRFVRLSRRFETVCGCLEACLKEDGGTEVDVPLSLVLSPLFRLASLSPKSLLFKPSSDSLSLLVLPQLYVMTANTLSTLVAVFGRRLFKHGVDVNRLALQLLNNSKTQHDQRRNNNNNKDVSVVDSRRPRGPKSKAFQRARSSLHRLLQKWFPVFPSCDDGAKGDAAGKFLDHFLIDARLSTPETAPPLGADVNANNAGERNKKNNKKRRRLGVTDGFSALNLETASSSWKGNDAAEAELTASALDAAAALLLTQGRSLSPQHHKSLAEFLLPLLLSLNLRSSSRLRPLPAPYHASACREAAFGALEALLLNPHPRWPPPLAAASAVFLGGQSADASAAVRRLCLRASLTTTNLIRPRVAPLQMPLDLAKELTTTERADDDATAAAPSGEKGTPPEIKPAPEIGVATPEVVIKRGGVKKAASDDDDENEGSRKRRRMEDSATETPVDTSTPLDETTPLPASRENAPPGGGGREREEEEEIISLPQPASDDETTPNVKVTPVVKAASPSNDETTPKKAAPTNLEDYSEDSELAAMLRDFDPDGDPDS